MGFNMLEQQAIIKARSWVRMVRLATVFSALTLAFALIGCEAEPSPAPTTTEQRPPSPTPATATATVPSQASPPPPTLTAPMSPAPTLGPAATPTRTPEPTPTPAPTSTAVPTATPSPTASPPPTPAPTPPKPTRTPAPRVTPTPIATPMVAWSQNPDDYITWRIGDEVSPHIEAEVRFVVLAMHDYLVDLDFPPITRPVTIFLYHDLDSLAAEFKATTGKGLAEGGAEPAFAEGRRVIVSTRDWIALNTSVDRYQVYSPVTRKRILGTNLFSVYQRAVSGLSRAPSYNEVPPVGPYWLSRGAAEFITFEAMEASDPESCDVTRGRFAGFSGTVDTPLSDAETRAGFESMRSAYQHSFLAAELLESQASEGALGAYFASLRLGNTWQEAFQTAFGTTVEEFYQLFEEHRAAGFPNPDAPAPSATMPGAPDYVKWHMGPNVRQEDLEPLVKGARLMHEYVTSLGLPEISREVPFYVFHKVDGLAPVYYAVIGVKPNCFRKWWYEEPGKGKVAEQSKGGIFMTTYDLDHDSLTKISAHELIHAYQSGFSVLPHGSKDHEVPRTGPRWLREGIAEYFAYRAMDLGGVFDYDTKRNSDRGFAWRARQVDKPLEEMETRQGYLGVRHRTPFRVLAAELLAFHAGEDALLRFSMLQQPGTTWQGVFEPAFGMTVDEFYQLFEAHHAAGFPDPNRPTPTGPQAVDDYIVWKVGGEVSPTVEAEARETVLAAHDYAVGIGMPRIDRPITIFLYHDLDSLAAAFEANTGEPKTESWYWPEFSQGKRTILAGRDWIAVNTSATRYQEWSPDIRKRELAGHLFSVYRRALTGIWQGTPRDAVGPEGPQWLRAGSREYLTSQALRAPSPESCDPTRSRYARIRNPVDTPLSDAETRSGYESMRSARQHSFLAVELLAEQAGQESIMGYFASLRPGAAWQEAFEQAFGMTVEEFYHLFEEHRAAGFPEPGRSESVNGPTPTPGPFDHLLQDPSLPPFIRWDVESTVDSRDVEAAIWGVKLMGELQQSLGLPDSEVPINIVIYKDMEKMACNYAIALGWDLETSRKYWANASGVSERGNIHIRASTPQWLRTEPNLLMRTMVHELTHAHFQAGISGLMTNLSGHSRGSTHVPRWLVEGTAMLVTAMLLRENYPEIYYQHERFRAEQASNALATGLTLRDSETWPPSEAGTVGMDEAGLNIVDCIYSCGYFAAELLASRVGVGKLFDYYLLLEPWMTPRGSEEDFPRPGWRLAFEKAYDMPVKEFYDLFEEHRAAGFPKLDVSK